MSAVALGEGGAAAAAAAAQMHSLDPLAVMALIREYVISRSPPLSSRHYVDTQRVANRVWSQHFKHKAQIRGKVVETFEQLSTMADIMAAKIKVSTTQLERAKDNERFLKASLKRTEAQRRSLETQLERRNQLVRDISGVPRKQRPESAVSRTLEVVGPEAMLHLMQHTAPDHPAAAAAAHALASTPPRPHSAAMQRPPASASPSFSATTAMQRPPASASSSFSATAAMQRPPASASSSFSATAARLQHAATHQPPGPSVSPQGSAGRPQSAPAKRPLSAAPSPSSSRYTQPEGLGGAVPRHPRQQQQAGQQERQVHVSPQPLGSHWSAYASPRQQQQQQQGIPQGVPVGSSAGSAGALAEAAGGAGAGGGGAWSPLKKADMEASFLSRLQRSASCMG